VAGLSMGGYGAVKWALLEPGRFAAAASLSGALDVVRLRDDHPQDPVLFDRVFGQRPPADGPDDLMWLVRHADVAQLPPLYMCCGTEDELYADNLAFRDACAAARVPVTTDFGPGAHDWSYWDAQIQRVLAWLPLAPPG
jgi:putative tributyrin esterase